MTFLNYRIKRVVPVSSEEYLGDTFVIFLDTDILLDLIVNNERYFSYSELFKAFSILIKEDILQINTSMLNIIEAINQLGMFSFNEFAARTIVTEITTLLNNPQDPERLKNILQRDFWSSNVRKFLVESYPAEKRNKKFIESMRLSFSKYLFKLFNILNAYRIQILDLRTLEYPEIAIKSPDIIETTDMEEILKTLEVEVLVNGNIDYWDGFSDVMNDIIELLFLENFSSSIQDLIILLVALKNNVDLFLTNNVRDFGRSRVEELVNIGFLNNSKNTKKLLEFLKSYSIIKDFEIEEYGGIDYGILSRDQI